MENPYYVDENKPWFQPEAGWPPEVPKNLEFPEISLYEALAESAAKYKDYKAIWFLDTFMTFGELHGHVLSVAAGLAAKKPKASTAVESLSEGDRALFEELRELRKQIAAEQGVPPYVIFHDSTLIQMASKRPVSSAEMLALVGVGTKKLEKHGDAFLRLLTGG